jgi:hypothetical protein
MRSPVPRPAHRSFADPSGNIFGVKLCTDVTIRPNFSSFFYFSIVFVSFRFVILFFFFSPSFYPSLLLLILLFLSLLILLVGAILRLLILLFLYFDCLFYRHACILMIYTYPSF